MSYAATAGGSLPSMTAAPGVLALQRAMVWLVGACGAIVFIEPSPYELATLAASLIFFATGLRMRLVFMPLLLLLFLFRRRRQTGGLRRKAFDPNTVFNSPHDLLPVGLRLHQQAPKFGQYVRPEEPLFHPFGQLAGFPVQFLELVILDLQFGLFLFERLDFFIDPRQ